MTSPRRPPPRAEQGTVLLLVTAAMTMLLSVAALVLDLGASYVSAREMQNAGDAAALAGTHTLDAMHLSGASPASTAAAVDATARRIAARNGAQSSLVTCTLIKADGSLLVPCADATGVAAADGVQVSAGAVNQAVFARALGVDQQRVDRVAAATIQPLAGQDGPFLACYNGRSGLPDLLLPLSPAPPTGPPWRVNPAAVSPDQGATGPVYRLHGPSVPDCGLQGSSFKGDAGPGPFALPGWLPSDNGVKAGQARSVIAGYPGCGTAFPTGCVLVVPICSTSDGAAPNGGQMHCELFGAFRLVASSANTQDFRLLGAVTAVFGAGGDGSPGTADIRLIRLIR